jgi:hypothetical protein
LSFDSSWLQSLKSWSLRQIRGGSERQLELHQRADTASMELATMVRALEIAIVTAAKALH